MADESDQTEPEGRLDQEKEEIQWSQGFGHLTPPGLTQFGPAMSGCFFPKSWWLGFQSQPAAPQVLQLESGKPGQDRALQKLQCAKLVKYQDRGELTQTVDDLMAMGRKMNKKNCQLEHELAVCRDKLARTESRLTKAKKIVSTLQYQANQQFQVSECKMQLLEAEVKEDSDENTEIKAAVAAESAVRKGHESLILQLSAKLVEKEETIEKLGLDCKWLGQTELLLKRISDENVKIKSELVAEKRIRNCQETEIHELKMSNHSLYKTAVVLNTKMKSELVAQTGIRQCQEAEVDVLMMFNKKLKSENKKLESLWGKSIAQIKLHEKEIQCFNDEKAEIKGQLEAETKTRKCQDAEIKHLKKELEIEREKVRKLEDQIQKTCDSSTGHTKDINKGHETVTLELSEMQGTIEKLEDEIRLLKSECRALNDLCDMMSLKE